MASVLYIGTHGGAISRPPLTRQMSRLVTDRNDFIGMPPGPPTEPKEFLFGRLEAGVTYPSFATHGCNVAFAEPAFAAAYGPPEAPLFNAGGPPVWFTFVAACSSAVTDDLAWAFSYPMKQRAAPTPNIAYVGYKIDPLIATATSDAKMMFQELKRGKTVGQALAAIDGDGLRLHLYGDSHAKLSTVYTGNSVVTNSWRRHTLND
jgi:hypothetical protein